MRREVHLLDSVQDLTGEAEGPDEQVRKDRRCVPEIRGSLPGSGP